MVTTGRRPDTQRRLAAAAPVLFALVAMCGSVLFSHYGAETFDAVIVEDSVRRVDGRTFVRAEFSDGNGIRRGELPVTARQASQPTITVRTTVTGELEVEKAGIVWPSPWFALLAAVAGAALGFVVALGAERFRARSVVEPLDASSRDRATPVGSGQRGV